MSTSTLPRRSSTRTSSPTEGVWYKDQKGRYYTYPEDWTKSFYGARDALSNLLTYGDVSEKDKAAAKADYAALQKDIMKEFAEMKAAVAAADTKEESRRRHHCKQQDEREGLRKDCQNVQ